MKIIFSLLIIFLCIGHANAQVKLAVGTGVNFSNITISQGENNYSYGTGYYLSIRPSLQVGKNLSISADVQYSRKKVFENFFTYPQFTNIFEIWDFVTTLEYRPVSRIGIYGGLNSGFILSKKYYTENGNEIEFIDNFFDKIDMGYVFGLRFYAKERLSFNTQFSGGIIPLTKIEFTDPQGSNIGNGKLHLRNFQLGISYNIL